MDIDDFIEHIRALCALWEETEKALETAKTGEERETYGMQSFHLEEHIKDDLVLFGQMSANTVIQTVSAN